MGFSAQCLAVEVSFELSCSCSYRVYVGASTILQALFLALVVSALLHPEFFQELRMLRNCSRDVVGQL